MKDAWPLRSVASLASYINGYPFKPDDHEAEGLPVIRIKQLNDPSAETDYFSGRVPERNLLRNGDLVFSWSGSLCVKEWNRGPAWLNQHLFRVIPVPGVDKAWLRWALEFALVEFESRMHGSAMTHITKPMMREVRLPLPPLDVQRRIADFLDDQVGIIDVLVAQRKRQTGLLAERVETATGHRAVGLLEEHRVTRLSRFFRQVEQGGSPLGSGSPVLGEEPGVVKTSCVSRGRFLVDENKALLTPDEFDSRFILRPGDLLVVRGSGSGDLVADSAVVSEEVLDKRLMLSDLVYRLVDLRMDARFVCAFLLSAPSRAYIRSLVRQGSGPAKVRGEDLGSIPFPVVDGETQERFADEYWQARDWLSMAETSIQAAIGLLGERKRALITATVNGEFDVESASSRAAEVALAGMGGAV